MQWNSEKFLLTPNGTIAARFRPRTEPESQEVVAAIEAVLPGRAQAAARAAGGRRRLLGSPRAGGW